MSGDPCRPQAKAIDVIDVLSDLFLLRGIPAHIRSDNGPEFVAKAVQEWIAAVGAKIAYIERASGIFVAF
jgi:putative transposase